MSKSNPKGAPSPSSQSGFKHFINNIPPILSFGSLLFGVILAAISIFHSNLEAEKLKAETTKLKIEAEKLQKELSDSDVKFAVQYIDIRSSVFQTVILKHIKQENAANYTFQYFPVVKNNILQSLPLLDDEERQFPIKILPAEIRNGFPPSASVWRPMYSSVVLLSIQQIGKRKARDVQIEASYVNIGHDRAIDFYTTSDLNSDDWIKELDGQHSKIQLSDLNTGEGILVPLFVTYGLTVSSEESFSRVIMNSIYIPLKIIYTDDFDQQKKEINIRPILKDSIEVSADIEIRG